MRTKRSRGALKLEESGQLAFDLFGEHPEAEEQNNANIAGEQNSRPATAVGSTLGTNGELFGEGWAGEQQSDAVGRDENTRQSPTGLAGTIGHGRTGYAEPARRERRIDADVEQVRAVDGSDQESGVFSRDLGGVGQRPDRGGLGRHQPLVAVDRGEAWSSSEQSGRNVRSAGSGNEVTGVARPSSQESRNYGTKDRQSDISTNLGDDKSSAMHVVRRTGSERAREGVLAVTVLKQILQESREATDQELEILAKFPGWGATGELFDESSSKYAEQTNALKDLWSGEEWNAASRTIINAHYTDPRYVAAMWKFLDDIGVPRGAEILEPGSGKGNFINAAREGDRLTGIELDPTSAKISELLNPQATIKNESFADTVLEGDGFDAVIGNVPFSEVTLYDPIYNRSGHSMHNAFIIKALRLTKPGGVIAVMTSRWTLDAKRSAARAEMAKYGELIGAVRQPKGAHQDTAGTDAIIDTLIFKRHLDEAPEELPEWVTNLEPIAEGSEITINSYFAKNPDHVLGEVKEAKGRFGAELTVVPPKGGTGQIAEAFGKTLQKIKNTATETGLTWEAANQIVTDRPPARVKQNHNLLVGRIYVDELGELKQIGLNGAEPVKVPKNTVEEVKHLIELKDTAVALLEAEAASPQETNEINVLRKDLNDIYDTYVQKFGPLGRFTQTVKEHLNADGTPKINKVTGEELEATITRRYPASLRALRLDPHYATLIALERFNEDTLEARKATIFEQRVVSAEQIETNIESPSDAIRVSKDRYGTVDAQFIAESLNINVDEVENVLGDLVFRDPANEEEFIPREEYLSGQVREKLKIVTEKAETNPEYLKHVKELKKILPVELGPAEITARIGASWIPIEDTKEFIAWQLQKEVTDIHYIGGNWDWKIRGREDDYLAERWGIKKTIGPHIGSYHALPSSFMKTVMNLGKLTYSITDEEGKTIVDQAASDVATARAEELNERFQDWLWQDGERAERLQTIYNDLYNGIVLRNYDDVRLTFPGKAATFTPHPHQHAAVARMIAEPSTGLFHEVGAGKTAEMVMGVMELKRLGLVQRPALIVPNHMLDQFTREFKQIYPRAKVLAAGSGDMAKVKGEDGRKLFVARTKTNDWDAVILTHTAFNKIGLGGEAENQYLAEKIEDKRNELEDLKASGVKSYSQKKLEQDLLNFENALKKSLTLDYDPGITWAETGIDYLCVDEAHLFKNLGVSTRVDDLRPSSSARARDLDMKLWYHREYKKQDRVVTLATATPVANNMAEMFVMMNYLRPDLLAAAKVSRPDEWAKQFTVQETQMEVKPESSKNTSMQVKTRTTKFKNMPELLAMWHIPGDIKTQSDLKLPVPKIALNSDGKPEPELIITPATKAQEEAMDEIMERGEKVRAKLVDPTEDNMLKLTSDGRAIALDARLRNYEGPLPEEHSKINEIADRIYEIWEETKDNIYLDEWGEPSTALGGLQIVFADIGTPKNDDTFDIYNELRNQLRGLGMDASKIRFAHEATNDKAKAELQQQCRDGRVDVIIGSTEKMGVGTNIQTRAVALHHMDPPWRPADIIQREGRIVRQGNQNSEVKIFRYGTQGSFDSYMWGTLARKARFIEQVLAGRLDVREIENTTEQALQFAEMQAITLGDMRILEIANLKREVEKLGRQERAHARQITALQSQLDFGEQTITRQEKEIQKVETIIPNLIPTTGDAFKAEIKYNQFTGAHTSTDRAGFQEDLQRLADYLNTSHPYLSRYNEDYPAPTGATVKIGGIEWAVDLKYNSKSKTDNIFQFKVREASTMLQFELPWSKIDPARFKLQNKASNATSFETRAARLPETLEKEKNKLADRNQKIGQIQEIVTEEFPQKQLLIEQKSKLEQLEKELMETENAKVEGIKEIEIKLPINRYALTGAVLRRLPKEAVVEIDTDMGEVTVTAGEALQGWNDLSPGEGFEIMSIGDEQNKTLTLELNVASDEFKFIKHEIVSERLTNRIANLYHAGHIQHSQATNIKNIWEKSTNPEEAITKINQSDVTPQIKEYLSSLIDEYEGGGKAKNWEENPKNEPDNVTIKRANINITRSGISYS